MTSRPPTWIAAPCGPWSWRSRLYRPRAWRSSSCDFSTSWSIVVLMVVSAQSEETGCLAGVAHGAQVIIAAIADRDESLDETVGETPSRLAVVVELQHCGEDLHPQTAGQAARHGQRLNRRGAEAVDDAELCGEFGLLPER